MKLPATTAAVTGYRLAAHPSFSRIQQQQYHCLVYAHESKASTRTREHKKKLVKLDAAGRKKAQKDSTYKNPLEGTTKAGKQDHSQAGEDCGGPEASHTLLHTHIHTTLAHKVAVA